MRGRSGATLAAALLAAGLSGATAMGAPTPAPRPEAGAPEAWDPPCGWPEGVQARALELSTRLMPASLRRILERHQRAVAEGARRAAREGHAQGPLQADGSADRLAVSLARISALLDGHAPMKEVAREMGVAAHLVADLSNPFRTAPGDTAAAAYQRRFARYLDERLPKLRVVFEGYTHPLLEQGDLPAFGRRLADRSRSYVDDLIGAYRRFDATPDPALFDERSVPFGVASLSFSRTVTDTARAWLHAWRRAHGDLGGLPYPLDGPPGGAADLATREDP